MSLPPLSSDLLHCRRCPRLVAWREQVAREKRRAYRDQEYWGRPVPGFGDAHARVLVVGLAPGAHGSNRTGRMFTGDASGDFLYPALYRAGFANRPHSLHRADGLALHDLYITAVCRCAPPGNRPTRAEMDNCQPYLEREIALLQPLVLVALGRIAFERLLRILAPEQRYAFTHGAQYEISRSALLPQPSFLLCSYHPSRQNTQTGRLTAAMFDMIWQQARRLTEMIIRQ